MGKNMKMSSKVSTLAKVEIRAVDAVEPESPDRLRVTAITSSPFRGIKMDTVTKTILSLYLFLSFDDSFTFSEAEKRQNKQTRGRGIGRGTLIVLVEDHLVDDVVDGEVVVLFLPGIAETRVAEVLVRNGPVLVSARRQ